MILFLLVLFFLNSCKKDWASEKGIVFNSNKIYLLTRSGNSKLSSVAKFFNMNDTISSHVGMGIVRNGIMKVYHVIDSKTNDESDLKIESLEAFIGVNSDNLKISHISIWESKPDITLRPLLVVLDSLLLRKIEFDYEFNLNNKKLYCSELCSFVLNSSVEFDFKPKSKNLNSFFKDVLKRKNLEYFPVDFFQESSKFTKIYEDEF